MSARTYFYAGYSDAASTGFHHRSDALGACIRHMDADTVKHGDRNRFVVRVDACAYAPDRANDKRGTLARFLLVNSLVCVHGTMPAAVVERIASERIAAAAAVVTATPAPSVSTAILLPNGATLLAMLATLANRSHLRPVSSGAGNVRLAMATYAAADVDDAAGSAELAESGKTPTLAELLASLEDDETPEERKLRLRAERRNRVAMHVAAESAE